MTEFVSRRLERRSRSFQLAIPSEWVRRRGLEEGSWVRFFLNADGDLVIARGVPSEIFPSEVPPTTSASYGTFSKYEMGSSSDEIDVSDDIEAYFL